MIQIFSADGRTGRTGRDQSKVVQEVLADLKTKVDQDFSGLNKTFQLHKHSVTNFRARNFTAAFVS